MCGDPQVDVAVVAETKDVRARKPHRCCACGETIRVGDVYCRTGTLFEGKWTTNRHCLRCWAILDALWFDGDSPVETGDAVEWTLDCGEEWEDPPEYVAQLAFLLPHEMQIIKGHG